MDDANLPRIVAYAVRAPRRPASSIVAILLGVFIAGFGGAGVAQDLPDRLRACASEKDDTRRLACYDAEVARLGKRPAAPAGPSTPATASVQAGMDSSEAPGAGRTDVPAAVSPEDAFGKRGDLRKDTVAEAGEITSSVVSFSRGADQRFVVTLQNGQVWREVTPNSAVRLQQGDTVRIERGSLGSFVLVGPAKRSSKVKRIR